MEAPTEFSVGAKQADWGRVAKASHPPGLGPAANGLQAASAPATRWATALPMAGVTASVL
jgi:hypothetical protein